MHRKFTKTSYRGQPPAIHKIVESVTPLGDVTLGVLNDNNYPFSSGRTPGQRDPNEFIVIRLISRSRVERLSVRLPFIVRQYGCVIRGAHHIHAREDHIHRSVVCDVQLVREAPSPADGDGSRCDGYLHVE